MTHMVTVGIRELRQNLSKHIKRVKAGETLIVTERGREVARLVPREPQDDYERMMVEKFGARLPTKTWDEVRASLPPIEPRPAGTADRILDDLRRRDDPYT